MPIESGGGGGKVVYIDTEDTFWPERVAEITRFVILLIFLQKRYDCCIIRAWIKSFLHFCSARGLDDTEVLDNVLYARLTNLTQQIKMIPKIAAIIASDEMSEHIRLTIKTTLKLNFGSASSSSLTDAHRPYRLVIIDNIMGLFRVDYSGRD